MQGRLAMFQCVSRSFWYDLVRTQVEEARARAATGDYETPGFGEGARAVVARIMALGRTLKHHVRTRAEGVVRTAGLRTLDAIHVATAVLVSSELGSPLAYVTADR